MNMIKVLEEDAKKYGSRQALIDENGEISFSELLVKTRRLANGLADMGVRKGDKVALMMINSIEYVVSYMALCNLGAVAVPLDMGIKDELKSYLHHAGAKCLIIEDADRLDIAALKKNVDSLEHVLSKRKELKNLMENGSETPIEVEVGDSDISMIFYTSGTTGRPKGVMWNRRHLGGGVKALGHRNLLSSEDKLLCAIPMSHSGGLTNAFACVFFGATVVMMERFNPVKFISNVAQYGITCFFIVPAMLEAVLVLKKSEEITLSTVKWIALLGSMSSPLLAGRLQKLFNKAVVFSGYGLTETAPPTTLPDMTRKIKPGGVGQAVPWVEMRIVDENEKPLPAGEIGEVVIKGWVVMDGYYKEPEMTAAVIKDGWFHTGDLGKMDEEGELFLVGRKKLMVIVGGLNIYPEEVEAVLMRHPSVMEAVVIGVADELRGEKLKAFVALKPGSSASREDIVAHCLEHLPPFKTPRLIEFMDELPKLASGKIARSQLT
jgi:long-chain acyl-CoA synthetase